VEGGMEDWAYAGSWENNSTNIKPIKQCQPKTVNKYAQEKTSYDDSSLKNVMYLVETAREKRPRESELGNDTNVFNGNYILI
jgi:hypothetical protein